MKTRIQIIEMIREDRTAGFEARHAIEDAFRTFEGIYDETRGAGYVETLTRSAETLGDETTREIIASLLNMHPHDGRISDRNRTWAETIDGALSREDVVELVDSCYSIHCAHLDQLADYLRKHPESLAHEPIEDEPTEEDDGETAREDAQRAVDAVRYIIEDRRARSAWDRGVKAYALELLEDLAEAVGDEWVEPWELTRSDRIEKAMLNGAHTWSEYSWGGCSLIYDRMIAHRLCTPSELKRTQGGEKDPNPRERWLDVQARALFQASQMILRALPAMAEASANGCPCW